MNVVPGELDLYLTRALSFTPSKSFASIGWNGVLFFHVFPEALLCLPASVPFD